MMENSKMLRSSIRVTMALIFIILEMDVIMRLLALLHRQSKSIKGRKRMIVRIKHNCSNLYIPYIGVIYSNMFLDSNDVKILPHGTAKSANASPYTRTSQKTLERERTLLTEEHSAQETYIC